MEMQTTVIYRVESTNGFGPYCYDGTSNDHHDIGMGFIDSGDHEHPCTSEDEMLSPFFHWDHETLSRPLDDIMGGREFRHGFRNVDTMLAWFHSCSLDALMASNYRVVEYVLPVNRALHGTYQSIFNPDCVISSSVFLE